MSRQISDYQVHATRIEQNEDQRKLQNNEPNVQLMGGCTGGWFCGTYWVTVTTQNGTVISVVTECDPQSWYYIEVCNSSGGGGLPVHPGSGGGSGGNGGGDGDGGSGSCPDPTMPCDSDGNPPDPCSWMMDSPAWMCGNPCQTGNSVIDEVNVQQAMHEAWEASYGSEHSPFDHDQRNEAMVIVTATSSGYEFETVPPGPNTSSCHFSAPGAQIPSNVVALIHTHPYSHNDVLEDPRCPSAPYLGDSVSSRDSAVVQAIHDAPSLPSIPMYVIDKDKIRVIQPSNPSQYAQTFNRCGY